MQMDAAAQQPKMAEGAALFRPTLARRAAVGRKSKAPSAILSGPAASQQARSSFLKKRTKKLF
jgi:hypothetical protein